MKAIPFNKPSVPPDLISHHLSKLRYVGLVDVERDPVDPRWMYYSINRATLDELNTAFGSFFDPHRIQPRKLTCGLQILNISVSGNSSEEETA